MINEQRREVSITLRRLDLFMRVIGMQTAQENGLYFGQLPALEYIEQNEGCTQRALADRLGISPPCVATSVKRMQRAGLIKKVGDEQDLRVTRLYTTELGRAHAARCRTEFDRLDAQMLSGFSEEELSTVQALLLRMIENIGDRQTPTRELIRQLRKTVNTEKEA